MVLSYNGHADPELDEDGFFTIEDEQFDYWNAGDR